MPEDLPRGHVTGDPVPSRVKPTVMQLGIDLAAQDWQRSGTGDGSFEVAFVRGAVSAAGGVGQTAAGPDAAPAGAGSRCDPGTPANPNDVWVLLRVAGDPDGRVLVYDRVEWECFLDGASRGEFDDAE